MPVFVCARVCVRGKNLTKNNIILRLLPIGIDRFIASENCSEGEVFVVVICIFSGAA